MYADVADAIAASPDDDGHVIQHLARYSGLGFDTRVFLEIETKLSHGISDYRMHFEILTDRTIRVEELL
jgi:hypothetical protein